MQRRLAAILAADVASYSLLMNADEDSTYKVWKTVREGVVDPLISQFDGRIVKHTGDGFLVEFPTVLAAVDCGTLIQEQMAARQDTDVAGRPFQFRVGINLGDIIVDNEDIHGDGVNIAARLEGIAEPGGVCVSGDVYRQVRNKPGFVFNDLGQRRVKNIRTPLAAYSVMRSESVPADSNQPDLVDKSPTNVSRSLGILFDPARLRGGENSIAFVGREKERALVDEAFTEAVDGQGNIVLIRGEPGIGKSTLARQCIDGFGEESALVLYGQCHETLGSPPYWPWLQILKALDLKEEYDIDSCRRVLDRLDGSESSDDTGHHSSFSTDSGADQFVLFNQVSEVLAEASSIRTLVLFIDDLHWADRSSLLLLSHFGTRIFGLPVLVIGTYRDIEVTRKHRLSETMAELNRDAKLRRIALKGLERRDVADVMTRVVGQVVPENVVATLYDKTGGNPLFVSEMAGLLRAQNVDFGHWESLELEMPEGIQEAAGQRFNQLSDECVTLLSIASVIGRRFSIHVLSKVQIDMDELRILELIEEAVDRGLLRETREHGANFEFRHVLFRDLIYDELSMVRKTVLHGKVADVLAEIYNNSDVASLGEIARHYYRALRGGKTDRVLEFAGKAATEAAKMAAFAEVVEYHQLMLEIYDLDEQQYAANIADSCAVIVDFMQHSGRKTADGWKFVEKAMKYARITRQYDVMVRVVCRWTYWARWQQESPEIVQLLDDVLGMLDDDATALRASVTANRSIPLVFVGRQAEAEASAAEAIELAEISGDAHVHSTCLCLYVAALRGKPERLKDRIAMASKALKLATESNDLPVVADALEWLILSEQESGNFARVCELVSDLEHLSSKLPRFKNRYAALNSRVWVLLFEGNWDAAELTAERALEAGKGKLDSSAEGIYGAQLFLINREKGRLPMIATAVRSMVNRGENIWNPGLLATYVEANMFDEAHVLLTSLANDGFADLKGDELHLTCLVYFIQSCVDLGRNEYASQLLEKILPHAGQFVSHPTAVSYGPADLYIGMLHSLLDDYEESDKAFTRAAQSCKQAGTTMWSAHVAYRHAQMLVAQGRDVQDDRFTTIRETAKSHADRMGMENILARLKQLKAAPNSAAVATSLSAKELEVLRLIAEGKSNKAIAAELSRSLPTIATHVRSILGKTNCANRTEAAAYARERNLL